MIRQIIAGFAWAGIVSGAAISTRQATRESCPGYLASDVAQTATGFTAKLSLRGAACNVHGTDVPELKLIVNYDSSKCIQALVA